MSAETRDPAAELRAGIVAHGLLGTTTELPSQPLDDDAWSRLYGDTWADRTTGLLAAAISSGALATTPDQAEQAYQAHAEEMSSVLLIERWLLDHVARLAAAGIETCVLKGSAVAHLDYPDPALRSFCDVDLLVRTDDWDRAVEILTAGGYARQIPQPRAGFDRRFSKGATFSVPDGPELDLHRTFVMGPFGLTVDLDAVWAARIPFALGGQELAALDREERFLHACYHAALGDVPPRLVALRDVAQMALAPELDVERARSLASEWRGDAVIARAINLAWETFRLADATALSAWAARLQTDAWQERALLAYLDRREVSTALSLATTRAVPGLRAKVSYIRALAFPDRDFVVDRYPNALARWRHAAQVLERLRQG